MSVSLNILYLKGLKHMQGFKLQSVAYICHNQFNLLLAQIWTELSFIFAITNSSIFVN